MSSETDKKYRQELEQSVGRVNALIRDCTKGVTPKKSTIVSAYEGLKKLSYMSSESARWVSRMLLLERRIRAAQKIFDGETKVSIEPAVSETKSVPVVLRYDEARALLFDGETKVSIEPAVSETKSVPVVLRYDEARALLQETSGKTGSLTEMAKRARDDIAQAIEDNL